MYSVVKTPHYTATNTHNYNNKQQKVELTSFSLQFTIHKMQQSQVFWESWDKTMQGKAVGSAYFALSQ